MTYKVKLGGTCVTSQMGQKQQFGQDTRCQEFQEIGGLC